MIREAQNILNNILSKSTQMDDRFTNHVLFSEPRKQIFNKLIKDMEKIFKDIIVNLRPDLIDVKEYIESMLSGENHFYFLEYDGDECLVIYFIAPYKDATYEIQLELIRRASRITARDVNVRLKLITIRCGDWVIEEQYKGFKL